MRAGDTAGPLDHQRQEHPRAHEPRPAASRLLGQQGPDRAHPRPRPAADQLMPSGPGTCAPGPLLLYTDYARSAVEFGSLFWAWPVLASAPRGDGHPVLVVPGLVTGDVTTFVLRTFLGRLGYRAQHRPDGEGRPWPACTARPHPCPPCPAGERDRLEPRWHLRPATRPAQPGRRPAGHHARERDPARTPPAEQRPASVPPLRRPAHRTVGTASRRWLRPAAGARHLRVQPPRRRCRLARLPRQAVSAGRECPGPRQSSRLRPAPGGAMARCRPACPAPRCVDAVPAASFH